LFGSRPSKRSGGSTMWSSTLTRIRSFGSISLSPSTGFLPDPTSSHRMRSNGFRLVLPHDGIAGAASRGEEHALDDALVAGAEAALERVGLAERLLQRVQVVG